MRLAKRQFGMGCLGQVRAVLSSDMLREGGVTREFEERFSLRVRRGL